MKIDTYRTTRGGWSRILQISCEKCEQPICTYQKDGPGPLKRMYWDRMIGFVLVQEKFICQNCKTVLGVEIVYEKEHRPAYRSFQDAVKKRIIKADV